MVDFLNGKSSHIYDIENNKTENACRVSIQQVK